MHIRFTRNTVAPSVPPPYDMAANAQTEDRRFSMGQEIIVRTLEEEPEAEGQSRVVFNDGYLTCLNDDSFIIIGDDRPAVYGFIRRNFAASIEDICLHWHMEQKKAESHCAHLKKQGWIVSVGFGNFEAVYPEDYNGENRSGAKWEVARRDAAERAESKLRVHAWLRIYQPIICRHFASALEYKPATVRAHLGLMRKLGLADYEGSDDLAEVLWSLTEAGMAVLQGMPESYVTRRRTVRQIIQVATELGGIENLRERVGREDALDDRAIRDLIILVGGLDQLREDLSPQ